jgi:hypothetical protein
VYEAGVSSNFSKAAILSSRAGSAGPPPPPPVCEASLIAPITVLSVVINVSYSLVVKAFVSSCFVA